MDGATESETRPCGGECCTRLKRLHERTSPAMPLPIPLSLSLSLSPSLSLSLDLVEVKTENDIPGALLSEPLEAHTMRERERERERHSRTSPFMKPLQPRAILTSTPPSL